MSSNGVGFYIKQLDFISQKPYLLINNNERIKSVYGACFTLLLAIFTLIFTVVLLLELFERNNPKILMLKILDNEDTQLHFPIFMQIFNSDVNKSYNNFFTFELNLKIFQEKTNDFAITRIPLHQCNEMKSYFTEFNTTEMESFYCMENDPSNPEQVITLNTFKPWLRPDINTVELLITVSQCSLASSTVKSCKIPDNDTLAILNNGKFELIVGFLTPLFEVYNTERPQVFSNIPSYIRQPLHGDAKHHLKLSFIKERYQTDYGYVFTDEDTLNILSLDNHYSILSSPRTDTVVATISITRRDPFTYVNKRTFLKGQNLLAEVGGVFHFLLTSATCINSLYSIVHFYLTVDKACRISFYMEKKTENRKVAIVHGINKNMQRLSQASSNKIGYEESVSGNNLRVVVPIPKAAVMKNDKGMISNIPNRERFSNDQGILNMNTIHFKKLYSLDIIDTAIKEFKLRVKYFNQREFTSYTEMFCRIMCFDQTSMKRKLYNHTVDKIREFLDVNNLIRMMIEFQFLKSILFSNNVITLIETFSDIKSITNDKVNDIHSNLREIYENLNNHETGTNLFNNESRTKDMDYYATEFFIETFMTK